MGVLGYAEFLVANYTLGLTFERVLWRAIAYAARYGHQSFDVIGSWSHRRLQLFNAALETILVEEASGKPTGD